MGIKDIFMNSIGFFSRWNATCGISMHAELVGMELIKMGYRLKVFAPHVRSANKWWHHKIVRNKEEDFVIRCYDELEPDNMSGGSIEEEKVLSEDFDWLIVESYASIPYKDVENLVNKLKDRGVKVVAVIHEGAREQIRYSSLRIFDAVVVFDERYLNEMLPDYGDMIEIIPFPCYPVKKGNRKFAEDILIFFSFGRQPINEYEDYIKALDALSSKFDFVYRVVRSNGLLPFERPWLKQEQKRLYHDEVYRLLHSSDIHLLPKGQTRYVVVSSTLCQCLGALTPTVVPNTRHFEALPIIDGVKPAVVYENVEDLKEKLVMLIEDEEFRKKVIKASERFVEENRSDKIARRFVKLFEEL
jgi:glycosyltransferase involved in cell wall biosynthesis